MQSTSWPTTTPARRGRSVRDARGHSIAEETATSPRAEPHPADARPGLRAGGVQRVVACASQPASQVTSQHLVGLALVVYARKNVASQLTALASDQVGVGIMGVGVRKLARCAGWARGAGADRRGSGCSGQQGRRGGAVPHRRYHHLCGELAPCSASGQPQAYARAAHRSPRRTTSPAATPTTRTSCAEWRSLVRRRLSFAPRRSGLRAYAELDTPLSSNTMTEVLHHECVDGRRRRES
jgi:hypothetical protein